MGQRVHRGTRSLLASRLCQDVWSSKRARDTREDFGGCGKALQCFDDNDSNHMTSCTSVFELFGYRRWDGCCCEYRMGYPTLGLNPFQEALWRPSIRVNQTGADDLRAPSRLAELSIRICPKGDRHATGSGSGRSKITLRIACLAQGHCSRGLDTHWYIGSRTRWSSAFLMFSVFL